MIIKEIVSHLEAFAPTAYQESYDNAGLIVGDQNQEVQSALITLDVTEEVLDEAIRHGCGMIIAHHPLIFKGIKKINGNNLVGRCLIKAIRNNIAIYASHTNIDSVTGGVNSRICQKLGLIDTRILAPAKEQLFKLVTFVPISSTEKVRKALFEAGAGHIGHYDQCSFNSEGVGTFRGDEHSTPFVGIRGQQHIEKETKIETILPRHLKNRVINALLNSHPYEEVAYDLYPLANELETVGAGMIGQLPQPKDEMELLREIQATFDCKVIKHTQLLNKPVRTVAVCGGAGSFLLGNALAAQADLFLSGDFKYHDFFEAESKILIADIGHYESEQFTKEVFYEILIKKIPTFALRLSDVKTNPVSYLC